MRRLPQLLLPLLLATTPAWAGPPRELVAQLSAPPGQPSARSAHAVSDRLATRFAALGLTLTRRLADDIALPLDKSAAALDAFDPARVVLLEARDAASAKAATLALADDPDVDWVEPNRTRAAQVWSLRDVPPAPLSEPPPPPDDPLLAGGYQYGLWNPGPSGPFGGAERADAHAREAWAIEPGRERVKIAIADTGIDPDHPDLAGLTFGGLPRITDAFNATNEPSRSVRDSAGHGTPVAGVAASRTRNGPSFAGNGAAGVAGGDGVTTSGTRLVAIKISPGHSGEASTFDIARALVWATSVGARAMNLSYAADQPSRIERAAMLYSILHGCVMVAAAGNKGYSDGPLPQYPAAHAAEGLCIQVGASDAFDRRAVFSSYGPGLDFMAAGLDVWTTFMTYPSYYGAAYPGYVAASGTSFAAPFGTGAVGLLASRRPELRDTDFQHVLRESADDIGVPGVDAETGWGRLNLARALEAVAPSFGIWHDEVAARSFSGGVFDTLVIGESGPGTIDRRRARLYAERIEGRTTVTLPDSFLTPYRVWTRLGGTLAVRGDFRLPWFTPAAEVAERGERSFTLRGYLYRSFDEPCPGCADRYVPLPPDQTRFGFTVIARVDRAPALAIRSSALAAMAPGDSVTVSWSASDPDTVSEVVVEFVRGPATLQASIAAAGSTIELARSTAAAGEARVALPCIGPAGGEGALRVRALDARGPHRDEAAATIALRLTGGDCAAPPPLAAFAAPNPFRGRVVLSLGEGPRAEVYDLAGRRVRAVDVASDGSASWDGRDASGRDLPAGLYLVRWRSAGATRMLRVAKLAR